MVLIKTEKLTKRYQTGNTALRAIYDVDLEINAGEFVAITGPSGAGKSTLLHLLGCLDTASTGDYFLEGQNVSHLKLDALAYVRNHKIGYVFQDSLLLPNLSATDNVALPLMYAGFSEEEATKRAEELLAQLGLEQRLNFYPWQLSGGQQQRVSIARALSMRPKLILADEPTGNLDSENAQLIMDLLKKLNREASVTVLLVTHEPDLAQQAQRMIVVHDGLVIEDRAIVQ